MKVIEGFNGTVEFALVKLARPQIHVVWKDTNNIEGVEVKLKKDGETFDFGKTGADGVARLKSDAKALLPGDYEAELVFDKKIYDREKHPTALKVTEALDGVLKVALIKLARPKFKIVDNTTGKEVQGVGLKLTLSGASSPNYDLGESRPSGIVELADVPGILPGKYDIKPAADRFGPTLNSPADVTLDEGSTTTTEVITPGV